MKIYTPRNNRNYLLFFKILKIKRAKSRRRTEKQKAKNLYTEIKI